MKIKKPITLLLLQLFCAFNFVLLAPRNPLETRINIAITHQSVEKALAIISASGDINFSYNSDQIPLDSIVNLNFENKEIYKILNHLLQNNFQYKTTGTHIIIQKKKIQKSSNERVEAIKMTINGSVYEFASGEKIANASVYNIGGKESGLTDKEGNFSLTLTPKEDILSISINKQSFHDTIIFIKSAEKNRLYVPLKPKQKTIKTITSITASNLRVPAIEKNTLVNTFVLTDMITHSNNINFNKLRPAQISFLPFLGTNLKLSGSIVNKFSLNILCGYSYGVDGVEIGSLLNINKNDVRGIQISGLGNITGRNTKGIQIAGFFNHNLGKFKGIQISGYYNYVIDTIQGAQISGFVNDCGGVCEGLQLAGFVNISKNDEDQNQFRDFSAMPIVKFKKVQISGFTNVTSGIQNGVQMTGFANITRGSACGFQLAGYANFVSQDFTGIQVSGLINYAKKVRGSQIGIINIADTISGVALGLLNFVRKGFRQLSLWADETGSANLNYSFGTNKFYTILGISDHHFFYPYAWGGTFGFGSLFMPKYRFNFNINLTYSELNIGKFWEKNKSQLYRFALDLNFRISKHFNVFAGSSFNVFDSNSKNPESKEYKQNNLLSISIEENGDTENISCWIGASLGLKYIFR